jgi:cysteine synthase A
MKISRSSAAKKPKLSRRPGRGRVFDSITEAIGDTPLVRLRRLPDMHKVKVTILAKLEYLNPAASVKDRIGVAMVEAMERAAAIGPDTVPIEPTSGNTGIALAFVVAARGYRLILVMPESMSLERRKMLKLLGAEIVLTPAAQGMRGAVTKAEELIRSTRHAVMPQQFKHPANPKVHRRGNLERYRRQDRYLRLRGRHRRHDQRRRAGAEATQEVVAHRRRRTPGQRRHLGWQTRPHRIQGIGAGFIPDTLDRSVIDEVVTVSNEAAFDTARALARHEGIPAGISSGAAAAAALEIGKRPRMAGKTIVVILPSFAERYLSTALFDGL